MKKTFKKMAVVALSAVMMTMSLAACGGSKGSSADASKWTFGTNAEFAPFEYVSSSDGVIGQYSGIDMEIIKKVAEDNGKEVEINNMEFDSLTVALKNGQIDGAIAGMTIKDERKEEVDFSEPYYVAKQVMIVKEGNTDIKKAADMADKKIAVVQGYTGEVAVKELGFEYEAFKKGTETIQELVNGKCDVVVIDSATANQYVKDNEGLAIVEDNEAFKAEEYGIAVKKGDTATLDLINASIKKFKEDGTIDSISAKYADMSEEDASSSDAE